MTVQWQIKPFESLSVNKLYDIKKLGICSNRCEKYLEDDIPHIEMKKE